MSTAGLLNTVVWAGVAAQFPDGTAVPDTGTFVPRSLDADSDLVPEQFTNTADDGSAVYVEACVDHLLEVSVEPDDIWQIDDAG